MILSMYYYTTTVQIKWVKSKLHDNVGISWLVLTLRLVNRE